MIVYAPQSIILESNHPVVYVYTNKQTEAPQNTQKIYKYTKQIMYYGKKYDKDKNRQR